ncbi:2-hydroxyacid dehydrogenase [Virgibacillus soli]|uniref:D-glycerate dehydrogenase n=1 Tax=Paracerasibacillus soli TaxID=480284 RepID=A0ABU5CQX9_9BACI|nr:D-glycerate dehydrogenase [Virgibacillus soli]MDY0408783.1 D-glycerate dehydrogenase [Virgibacillus soli]
MKKPTIYITRKLPEHLLQPYTDRFDFQMWEKEETPVPRDVLLAEAKKAQGLVCMLSDKIDQEFLAQNPQLKVISNLAVGFDNIDIKVAHEKGIVVTNTPDVLSETTADLTFALLMATARRLVEANEEIKANRWGDWSPYYMAGTDIHHKKIGIVGMGRIGEAVARRAKGFNMSILYHNRRRKERAEQELGARYADFETLITEADFIVSLVPLSEETKALFDKNAFGKMKKSAIFINASRGAVVDEAALYEALKEGEIEAAGLDVFLHEPIDSAHPLSTLKNVVCLPHIGSASRETRTTMIQLCLDNIDGVFYGDGPKTAVK